MYKKKIKLSHHASQTKSKRSNNNNNKTKEKKGDKTSNMSNKAIDLIGTC